MPSATMTMKGSPATATRSTTGTAPTVAPQVAYAPTITLEEVKAYVEEQAKSALDKALTRATTQIAEPLPWWDLFAIGPIQVPGFPGPLLPSSVIQENEIAFMATVLVLNPLPILPGPTSPGMVLSNFALPYQVRYQTGNLTSWALGPAGMNVTNAGALVPGQMIYVDVLGFTGTPTGMYEMNINARILGAGAGLAPQFAGFATATLNLDNAIGGFLVPTGPVLEFDQPIRFDVYA